MGGLRIVSTSFIDLGTRPLRIFAPLLALGGVVMIGFGIYFLATLETGTKIVAEGASGSSIEVPFVGGRELDIWARNDSGQAISKGSCQVEGPDEVWIDTIPLGAAPDSIGSIIGDRSPEDVLTCTTAQPTTITVGYEPGPARLIQGGGAIVIGLGALLMAGIGFLLRRRRRR